MEYNEFARLVNEFASVQRDGDAEVDNALKFSSDLTELACNKKICVSEALLLAAAYGTGLLSEMEGLLHILKILAGDVEAEQDDFLGRCILVTTQYSSVERVMQCVLYMAIWMASDAMLDLSLEDQWERVLGGVR